MAPRASSAWRASLPATASPSRWRAAAFWWRCCCPACGRASGPTGHLRFPPRLQPGDRAVAQEVAPVSAGRRVGRCVDEAEVLETCLGERRRVGLRRQPEIVEAEARAVGLRERVADARTFAPRPCEVAREAVGGIGAVTVERGARTVVYADQPAARLQVGVDGAGEGQQLFARLGIVEEIGREDQVERS